MKYKTGFLVSVFGEDKHFEDREKALDYARNAEYRYATGYVQVYECETGNMIFGQPR